MDLTGAEVEASGSVWTDRDTNVLALGIRHLVSHTVNTEEQASPCLLVPGASSWTIAATLTP